MTTFPYPLYKPDRVKKKRKFLAARSRNPVKDFWLTAFSGSGSAASLENPAVWLLKGDPNISDLYRLPFRRLPLLSGVS